MERIESERQRSQKHTFERGLFNEDSFSLGEFRDATVKAQLAEQETERTQRSRAQEIEELLNL